jgi:DNA-binding PadR family transcriptional regulator
MTVSIPILPTSARFEAGHRIRIAIAGGHASIQRGPLSGYDIKRLVERSVGHFWQESFGTMYPKLAELAGSGLGDQLEDGATEGGRARKRYRITAAGKRALAAWLKLPPQPHVERNELLLKVFFASHVAVDAK